MKRALLLLSLTVAALFAVSVSAEACSCMPPGPPCEAVWQAGLVFSGKVTEIVSLEPSRPGLPPELAPKRIRFAINEAFRGTDTKEIELQSRGGGSGMCDFDFRVGEEYLVYAHHRGDALGWATSTCSRTRLLRNAAEDLAYLRLSDSEKGRSRIVGQVIQRSLDRSSGYDRWAERLVPGVPVIVTDGKVTIETRTDSSGMYSVAVAPLRAYEVTFGAVDGLVVQSMAWRPNWIPDHRACAAVDAVARYDGRITGILTDSEGRSLPSFPVGLRSSPRIPHGPGYDADGLTDTRGRFEFRGIQPATYEIVAGTAFSSPRQRPEVLSDANITVTPSGRTDVGRLRLRLPATRVEGTVITAGGAPAAAVSIRVNRSGRPYFMGRELVTDARGRFRLSLVAGSEYEIVASLLRQDAAGALNETATARLEATPGTETIRLRLARSR